MRGGALPPALVCAALGLALSFAPRRAVASSLVVLLFVALAASRARIGPAWDDAVFYGCWATVALTAAAVHLRRGVGTWLALALALNAGLWSGAVVAAAGSSIDLTKALPFALLCAPGAWLIATRRAVAIKVMASWLVAVSILAAALSASPLTPGYEPDHLE